MYFTDEEVDAKRRDFPKVLLQVNSRVLASRAYIITYSVLKNIHSFLSISAYPKLKLLVSLSHLSPHHFSVLRTLGQRAKPRPSGLHA